jgi:hypothetical protein
MMKNDKNNGVVICDFYDHIDKAYPKGTALLINWVKANKIPYHPLCEFYPMNITDVMSFFDNIGIPSSTEPEYFNSSLKSVKYNWFYKDMGMGKNQLLISSEKSFMNRLETNIDLLENLFSYLENVKLSKR